MNDDQKDFDRLHYTPDKRWGIKYDRRRKPDNPRRCWERKYRKQKRLIEAGPTNDFAR